MHILITIITAIAGLVWALYRLQNSGVNLNAFNPFYWLRRRAWVKQVSTKPYYTFQRPLEAAALLIVGVAKAEGDMSRETKADILAIFTDTFQLDEPSATELLAANVYFLQDIDALENHVANILKPVQEQFSTEQKTSLLDLLKRTASQEGAINTQQQAIINEVAKVFQANATKTAW